MTPDSLAVSVISQVCPSGHFLPCLTLGTCPPHQVKRNLLNVSYRIAQYTDVISDLRGEIEHLKSKIEKQDKEKKSDPSVLDIQGSAKCRPWACNSSRPQWLSTLSSLELPVQHPGSMGPLLLLAQGPGLDHSDYLHSQ